MILSGVGTLDVVDAADIEAHKDRSVDVDGEGDGAPMTLRRAPGFVVDRPAFVEDLFSYVCL